MSITEMRFELEMSFCQQVYKDLDFQSGFHTDTMWNINKLSKCPKPVDGLVDLFSSGFVKERKTIN